MYTKHLPTVHRIPSQLPTHVHCTTPFTKLHNPEFEHGLGRHVPVPTKGKILILGSAKQ